MLAYPVLVFELQKLLSPTEREIHLDTRQGNQVANSVAPAPSARHLADYNREKAKHQWGNRKPACGQYNCHGMLFGARRTAIYEDSEVWKVLREDGYRQLKEDENPKPDDIVLYFSEQGAILHVARVMEVAGIQDASGDTGGQQAVNRLLSKWSDCWGEDFHALRDVPFAQMWPKFIFQIWTDRR